MASGKFPIRIPGKYFLAMVAALAVVALFPALSTFLPALFGLS